MTDHKNPNPPQSETPIVDAIVADFSVPEDASVPVDVAKALEARATEAEAALHRHLHPDVCGEIGDTGIEENCGMCVECALQAACQEVESLSAKLADAVRERDEARAQFGHTYCAYCNAMFPADAPNLTEHIGEHLKVCEKHPMREAEQARDAAEKALDEYKAIAREAIACRNDAADEVERLREELGQPCPEFVKEESGKVAIVGEWPRLVRVTGELMRQLLDEKNELTKLRGEIAAMRDLLRERCFWTANDSKYDRQGYSCNIGEDTALRDINYRDAKLWPTADEAIDAALAEMMEHGTGLARAAR